MRFESEEVVINAPIFGWYIFVRNLTFGGVIGYSSGKNNSRWKTPSENREFKSERHRKDNDSQTNVRWNGLPSGPCIVTSKYLKLSSCGAAVIPGAGSATSRSVSY